MTKLSSDTNTTGASSQTTRVEGLPAISISVLLADDALTLDVVAGGEIEIPLAHDGGVEVVLK
jgi:hypothetical protein